MSVVYEQARAIVANEADLSHLFRSVQKELLQCHILRVMNHVGLLENLTFKGGTCLRLCYRGSRFSEDLDFYGGDADVSDFNEAFLDAAVQGLNDIGVQAAVSTPELDKEKPVNRWWVRCVTLEKKKGQLERVERIKIELDDRRRPPSSSVQGIVQQFASTSSTIEPFVLHAASLIDICSDKLIAFPLSAATRNNPRYRDMWDILDILQRPVDRKAVLGSVCEKIDSGGRVSSETYESDVKQLTATLGSILQSKQCSDALRRFLPEGVARNTINDPTYRAYMENELTTVFREVLVTFNASQPDTSTSDAS